MNVLHRMVLAVSLCVVLAGAAARAQEAVTFTSGNGEGQGYLYLPPNPGVHPGLVLIHEWWGVTDWIKQVAQGYAAKGYVVLAVDLYHGKVADTPELAHELSRGLPQDQGVRDLTGAMTYLMMRQDVAPSRIGAVGWCMGGGFALQLAIAAPDLKAVVVNYGSLATDKAALKKIHADLLGNFGGQDKGIGPDVVHAFEATMQGLKKPVDLKIYPEAGHAFENPTNTAGYRAEDAADAMARTDKFLAVRLRP